MWNYNRQIMIRYAGFLAGLLLLASLYLLAGDRQPDLTSKTSIKSCLTDLAVSAEMQPWWVYLLFIAGALLTMAAGVPSITVFTSILLIKGFYPAFIFTWTAQTIVSFAIMSRACKTKSINNAALARKLPNLESSGGSFAFWSRIYYEFPLRTIDSITPIIKPAGYSISETITAIAPAIGIRLLIPSLWMNSFLIMISSFDHNPAGDINAFLMWSSALVVYTMIPRIPELFLCPRELQPILYAIEETSANEKFPSEPEIPASIFNQRNGKPNAAPASFLPGQMGTKPQLVK